MPATDSSKVAVRQILCIINELCATLIRQITIARRYAKFSQL